MLNTVEEKAFNIGYLRWSMTPDKFSSEILKKRVERAFKNNEKVYMGTPIERQFFDTPEILPIIINKVIDGLESAVILNPLITENKFSLKEILAVMDIYQMTDEIRAKAYSGLVLHDEINDIMDKKKESLNNWFVVKNKKVSIEHFENFLKVISE